MQPCFQWLLFQLDVAAVAAHRSLLAKVPANHVRRVAAVVERLIRLLRKATLHPALATLSRKVSLVAEAEQLVFLHSKVSAHLALVVEVEQLEVSQPLASMPQASAADRTCHHSVAAQALGNSRAQII